MALTPQQFERLKGQLEAKKAQGEAVSMPSDFGQNAKDFGIGVLKGAGSTVKGLADLGRPIQAALDPTKSLAEYNADDSGKISEEMVTADNNAQRVGKATELIAEFLLPIGGAKLLGRGAQATLGAAKGTVNKASGVAKAISEPITGSLKSENIMQRVARIPKGAQAKFEKNTGESVGTYLTKRNIYGDTEDISKQLYERFKQSKATADEALAQLPGEYSGPQIKTALRELEGKVTRTSSPGAPDPDLARVTDLIQKESTGGLTMSEINEAKRIFERRVRLDFLKTNVPEDVTRANNIDDAIRSWQVAQAEKLGLKNLPEINNETRYAKELLDAIGKESAGSAGNNALSLTDYILLAGGDPTAIGAFIAKKGFSAKGVQSAIAKKLYKGEVKPPVKAEFKSPTQ